MGIPDEVANIHMRTDAKNVVTTRRTIYLPEQKGNHPHVSMLRKEACSGSSHDLVHIPTPITSVQTRKLLDVDSHPDLRTHMEQPGVTHFCTQEREKEVFFLNTINISLAPTLQEGPFQVMFVETQQQKE